MKNLLITISVALIIGWLINALFPGAHWAAYAALGLAAGITSNKLERKIIE